MDKYEYRVKTEQMLGHMEKKQYKKAMEIADTIDWRRVKSTSMLNTVSEIYEFCGEFQKSRDILFVAFDRAPGSRKIIYRLGLLALKINDIEEASDCYEEFVKAAPKDPNQYILKYKILKAQNAPLTDQIAALEDFKKAEYVEKWAYELASLYHEAGMTAKCLEECDDLILWFSEGKYVYEAMELKMKYKPLTPIQQEKYDSRPGAPKLRKTVRKVQPEEPALRKGETQNYVKAEEADTVSSQTETEPDQSEEEAGSAESMESASADIEEKEAAVQEPADEEASNEEPEAAEGSEASEEPTERPAPIKRVVKGATLEEALANGVAIANNINIEEKAMAEREEELRIGGQMKIEEILQEWEEKQKINAEAIEKQKAKDNERLQKEREAARKRQEAERLEVERKAAEAEAARKAAEEEAARKAAEEEAAIRKAAEEEAARKAAEEEAEEKVPSGATQRLPDDIMELVDQLESRVAQAEEDSDDIFDVEEELELTSSEEELPENMPKEEPDGFFDDGQEDFEEVDYEDGGDYEEAEFEDEADYEDEDDYEEAEFEDEDDYEEAEFEDEADYEDEDDYEEAEFEDEADYEDEDDYEEAEFEDEDTFDKNDFFDEDFEVKDTPEEPLEIEEPSEEEIQRRIKKSKGGGVPFDTGFVVTGRYDLSATSEIGLKAGLTEEQKKLFSYFVPVRGMSEQIVEVLDNDRRAMREGTSKTGNLLVVGRKGSGKTVLAVDIVKAIQKQRNLRQGKVAIVTGESLNKKELTNIIQKLKGGAIIIEKAGKLNSRTIKELNHLMERKTGEMLFVLEDQRKPLERILAANPDFKKKFTSKLELPVFINDELVTFGQTYAKENGYKLDEMGILALYSRIDVMQREDHAVSVAEVKDIMDEAIAHSQKANVKHLARRVFGKSTDASDRIILKEEDFRI